MPNSHRPHLERGLNLLHATSLNVANMLGAGPFFTIPVLLAAMAGPQGMLGWIVALVIVTCDGLIWAELGAALPGSGGTYHYLREIFGGTRWGRFLPFLFMWQFLISGSLEVASGYIATAQFTLSLWPSYGKAIAEGGWSDTVVKGLVASVMVAVMFVLLCQRIRSLGWLSTALVVGVLTAVGTIIVLGAQHFEPRLISFPQGAFHFDWRFFSGLGAATSVAVYDYLGYYNICHLGEEVREPETTIPRSVLLSIFIVAFLYMSMSLATIGVVPWQEAIEPGTMAHENIAGAFMTKLYGAHVAKVFTGLIIWTCLAGLFAMTLGYSRIVYAAAKNGDFFRYFARLHPTRGYPWAALALLSGMTALFCFFPLAIVIRGAVVVRIMVQFIGQVFALHVLRSKNQHALP
ncbi:MAG TPA: APC family permease, partial [Lacipirellulaceae bacterium]|nr:APC family permease [Lacipirellulaceae bacterium]